MPRIMTRFTHFLAASAVALVCITGVAGCGDSDPSGVVVAQVGKIPISKAMLSEWMEAVTGGDYYEHLESPAPRGLVSEPANYPRCIKAAEKIVPRSTSGQLTLDQSQIVGKCRQLYQELKEQTLELLISIESKIGEGEELGIPPTEAEVKRLFARVKAEQFPKQAEYQAYLAHHEWPPSVEIFQLKRNLVVSKIEAKYEAKGEGWQSAFGQYLASSMRKWTAKTSCRAGYVVSVCKQYKPAHTSATTSPAILLEELAGRS
jgi:hypothetical protein